MCEVEGCSEPVKARGWCGKHYARWYRFGDPLALKYAEYGSDAESRLRHHGWEVTDSGCWEWGGTRFRTGYGQLQFEGVMWQAHRLSYKAWVGSIPEGLWILHACDSPRVSIQPI